MEGGKFWVWRKITESQVFQNEGLLKVWIWCLAKATWKERWIGFKTGKSVVEVKLMPGQFIYGRESASKELKMPPATIRNRMEKLKNMQNVDIKADRQYSIITILNWDTYQASEKKEDSEEDYQRTGKGQAKDTNNKDNNVNKDKKKEYSANFLTFYDAYPNKKDRDGAWKAWKKRNGDMPDLDILLDAIERQKRWRENANGAFRPEWRYPATWINGGCWNDEVKEEQNTGGVEEWLRLKKSGAL